MGPSQRSEMIKTLWRAKKDRFVIIHSSDADLVNVLADSVVKVLPTGIEIIQSQQVDHSLGSFKLIVQVEGGKPSDNLVRYLSKDVEGLTLEYQTDLLTYYIMPNISKILLHKKSCFMERNMLMLGLINFEFVSLPVFEMAARDIPSVIPESAIKDYEDSVEE